MVIPFGGISIAGGIAMFFLSLTSLAGTALVAGATALAASVLSLKEWKVGGSCTTYTLTSAACAAAVAYSCFTALPTLNGPLPYWLSAGLGAVSAAAAAFCLYNVAAGGNPPPKKGGAAKE